MVQGITDGHLLSGDYLFGRASVLCLVQRQCLSADLKYHLASPALSPAHQADALENNDSAFRFPEESGTPESKQINRALNRVGHILYNVKAETAQQEKYYELILDFVSTGLLVLNDNGAVYQKNKEALRLLGLNVFTHVRQ